MDDTVNGARPPAENRRTKVGRVMEEYDLESLGERLERRWLGIDRERQSLRELADWFNCLVLEAAFERIGEKPIDGEIENHYRLLTADEVTESARTQAETQLARYGIDVERIKRDFVSHQAIHTYLTEVREASLPSDGSSSGATITKRQEAIFRLRNRLIAVIERSLDSLCQTGRLSLGEFDVMVGLTVYCNDCETSTDITDLFDKGGCDCDHGSQ